MLWSNPPAGRITPRRATMRVRCPCRCPIEASARQVQDGSSPRGRRSLQSSRGCQHQDLPRRRQGALHTTERATGLLIVGAARPQPRRPVVRLGRDRGHNPAARIPPASEGTCWSAARHRPSARVVLDRRPQRHSGGPFSSPEAARSPPLPANPPRHGSREHAEHLEHWSTASTTKLPQPIEKKGVCAIKPAE